MRADQAEYEELNKQLNLQRHLVKANWVWSLPKIPTANAGMKALGAVINDWQLSGIFTGGSGNRYDLGFSYNTAGGSGEPDRLAGLRRPHHLHGRDRRRLLERSVQAVRHLHRGRPDLRQRRPGVGPQRPDRLPDLQDRPRRSRATSASAGSRQVQLRVDAFNAVQPGGSSTDGTPRSTTTARPTRRIRNSQFLRGRHGRSEQAEAQPGGFRRGDRLDEQRDQRQLPARDPVHRSDSSSRPRNTRNARKTRSGWAMAPTRFFYRARRRKLQRHSSRRRRHDDEHANDDEGARRCRPRCWPCCSREAAWTCPP